MKALKHLWEKCKSLFNSFFSKKEVAKLATPEEEQTVTPISRQPGLLCPKCSSRIQITIAMLLSGQPVYCTTCFLELTIDTDKSRDSLEALKKLDTDFKKAEEMVKQSKM